MTGPAESGAAPQRQALIADSNQARGSRLAQACVESGLGATAVSQGAAALEAALSNAPDLIVAELGLPLVCGTRLAEILRANPRTQSACFVFLGAEDGDADRVEVGDAVADPSAPREDVMRLAAEQLARRDRIQALDDASRAGDTVEGDLAVLPLADLLQMAQRSRKSGRVELERRGDGEHIALAGEPTRGRMESGFVTLRGGELLQARAGDVAGEKALFRMLTWREGRFVFESGACEQAGRKILAPVRTLIAEGMRQIAAWDRLALELPPLSARVELSIAPAELPNVVNPLTREVLSLLERHDRVRDLVDRCSFPDYPVLRTLHTLVQRNMLTIHSTIDATIQPNSATNSAPNTDPGGDRNIDRAPTLAPDPYPLADALFDAGQLRRLREQLRSRATRGAPLATGKVVLVVERPETLHDLLNLLRSLPAFEPFDAGGEPCLELAALGRLRLDDDLDLELLQLPAASAYRPLWPLAAQGALAALFVYGAEVSQRAGFDAELVELLRLRSLGGALHVLLVERKQRVCPEELSESLALRDDASLFLLPLDGREHPSALLRGLFARVVP